MTFILVFVGTVSTVTMVLTPTIYTIFDNAWAKEKIEGTEGIDEITGTPGDDNIDSKGGDDGNFGDTQVGDTAMSPSVAIEDKNNNRWWD